MTKHNLHEKRIINIDETGVNPEHTPRRVLAAAGEEVPGIISPRGDTTTVIAGCTAAGPT